MTRLRTAVLTLVTLAAWLACGCGANSPGGTVHLQLARSGNPTAPDISPPASTNRFRVEVLNPDGCERVLPSLEVGYAGSGALEVEVPDVPVGAWVVRLSALDEGGKVLAHLQGPVQVNAGSTVRLEGWLQPGAAAEGLLFVANSRGASLSIIRLVDGLVEDLPLPQNPQFLFSALGHIYVTLPGSQMVAVEGVRRNVAILPAPPGALCAVGGSSGIISFPAEGGIRFMDPSTRDFSGLFRTGTLARGVSSQVGSVAWVVNPGDSTMTGIDVPARKLNATLNIGVPGLQVDQNPAGNRIYVVGGGRTSGAPPFVRVLEPSGNLVRHFTNQLEEPRAVLVQGDRAYVTDSLRGELVVFRDDASPAEIDRLGLGPGAPTCILSDGDRLYISMEGSGEVVAVDLATLSQIRRFRVGLAPQGQALLR